MLKSRFHSCVTNKNPFLAVWPVRLALIFESDNAIHSGPNLNPHRAETRSARRQIPVTRRRGCEREPEVWGRLVFRVLLCACEGPAERTEEWQSAGLDCWEDHMPLSTPAGCVGGGLASPRIGPESLSPGSQAGLDSAWLTRGKRQRRRRRRRRGVTRFIVTRKQTDLQDLVLCFYLPLSSKSLQSGIKSKPALSSSVASRIRASDTAESPWETKERRPENLDVATRQTKREKFKL